MNPLLVEWAGTTLLLSAISFVGTPLAIAGALYIAIVAGGAISGGHFNPAVTLWAFLSGKVGSSKAIGYVVAQLLAAATVVALKTLRA
jgi:aquaporin Z